MGLPIAVEGGGRPKIQLYPATAELQNLGGASEEPLPLLVAQVPAQGGGPEGWRAAELRGRDIPDGKGGRGLRLAAGGRMGPRGADAARGAGRPPCPIP